MEKVTPINTAIQTSPETILNSLNGFANAFNNNKYVFGVIMILMNLGARYVENELLTSHKALLKSTILRRLLIFSVVFAATRDLFISLTLTAAFVIIVQVFLNPESQLCILPEELAKYDEDNDGRISPKEIRNAYINLVKEGKIDYVSSSEIVKE